MTAIAGLVWSAVKTQRSSGEMEMRCVLREMGITFSVLRACDVEHRNRAGPDVGGVAAAAVVGDGEHVALRLAGRDGAHDLQRFGIDDGDRLVQLGGDVEQAVFRAEDGAVRPHAVAEVDVADNFCAAMSMTTMLVPSVPGLPTPELP